MVTMEKANNYVTPHSLKVRIIFFTAVFTLLFLMLFASNWLSKKMFDVKDSKEDWDVLIFTQSWPNTVCMKWQDESPTNHSCRLPAENNIWTIHGLWPTKFGTLGPTFCNNSMPFNITQLAPIQSNLTEYWADVLVPQPANSFWQHEWRKHGTCSASVPQLNTELKYFTTGLKLLEEYHMNAILTEGGIIPNNNASVDVRSLWYAVKSQLGVNPYVHCLLDKITHQYYLQEMRICFNKTLQLVDCDGVRTADGFRWTPIGNCPDNKPIFYPDTVPPVTREAVLPPSDGPVVFIYKLLTLALWLTT